VRFPGDIGRDRPGPRSGCRVLLSRLAKVQHRLRGHQHGRRAGKRLIEPRPQLAMRKEVHPQQGDQVRQRPREAGPQLEVLEEQDGDQRRPDLDLEGIGAGPHEGLDLQVLFQGLEEQLDLPALLVERGDRRGPAVVGWFLYYLKPGACRRRSTLGTPFFSNLKTFA
jgi:hypothetical protein